MVKDSLVTFGRNAQDPTYLKNLHYFCPGDSDCQGDFPNFLFDLYVKGRDKEQTPPGKQGHYSPVVMNLQPSYGHKVNI